MPRHHRQKSRSASGWVSYSEIDIRHFIFGPKSRALDGVGSQEAHCSSPNPAATRTTHAFSRVFALVLTCVKLTSSE